MLTDTSLRRLHCSVGAIWTPILNIEVAVAATTAAAAAAAALRAAAPTARPPAAARGSGAHTGRQVSDSCFFLQVQLPYHERSSACFTRAGSCSHRALPKTNLALLPAFVAVPDVERPFEKKQPHCAFGGVQPWIPPRNCVVRGSSASAMLCLGADLRGHGHAGHSRRSVPDGIFVLFLSSLTDLHSETAGRHRTNFPRQHPQNVGRKRKIRSNHAGQPGARDPTIDVNDTGRFHSGSAFPRAGGRRPWTAAPKLGRGSSRGCGDGGGGGGGGEQKWWVRLGGSDQRQQQGSAGCKGEVGVLGGKLWGDPDEVH